MKVVIKDRTMQLIREVQSNHVARYFWIMDNKSSQYFATGSDAIIARQKNQLQFK